MGTISKAHADGRHASPHPDDRAHWAAAGCTDCALLLHGPRADKHGNLIAREGCDICGCGCKYWEDDTCVDCGTHVKHALQPELPETSNSIIALVREDDVEHDPWGTAMGWGFAVAEYLHFREGANVPDSLGYSPAPGASDIEPDDPQSQMLAELAVNAATMTEAAEMLSVFLDECKRLGKDY
jgi:hypothetical protein